MFCLKCGKELPDNAKFCPHCGNKIDSNDDIEEAVAIKPQPKPAVRRAPTPQPGMAIETCPHCGQTVQFYRSDIRPHRRFPHGFVYCPHCSKPIAYSPLYQDTYIYSSYVTTCPHCLNVVSYRLSDIRAHKRWPYGYFLCPVCKKPVGHHRDNAVRK